MDPQKLSLAFVAVAVAWSTGVALRRALDRRHRLGTGPAVALLLAGTVLLAVRPQQVPAVLALPLVLVAVPAVVAVQVVLPVRDRPRPARLADE